MGSGLRGQRQIRGRPGRLPSWVWETLSARPASVSSPVRWARQSRPRRGLRGDPVTDGAQHPGGGPRTPIRPSWGCGTPRVLGGGRRVAHAATPPPPAALPVSAPAVPPDSLNVLSPSHRRAARAQRGAPWPLGPQRQR